MIYADLENWLKTWVEARTFCEVSGGIPVFANGFESGNLTQWSVSVP